MRERVARRVWGGPGARERVRGPAVNWQGEGEDHEETQVGPAGGREVLSASPRERVAKGEESEVGEREREYGDDSCALTPFPHPPTVVARARVVMIAVIANHFAHHHESIANLK